LKKRFTGGAHGETVTSCGLFLLLLLLLH